MNNTNSLLTNLFALGLLLAWKQKALVFSAFLPFNYSVGITSTGTFILAPYSLEDDPSVAVTVTGPTTYRAALTGNDQYPSPTHLLLRPQVSTFNFTLALNSGSSVIDIPVGSFRTQTTITGPTTWITSLIAKYPVSAEVYAGVDPKDPHCNQSMSFEPAHLSTFVKYVTALSENQIWSTYMDDNEGNNYAQLDFLQSIVLWEKEGKNVTAISDPYYNPSASSTSKVFTTFTGPTTIYETITTLLGSGWSGIDQPAGPSNDVCGGICGICQLFYPEVFVYYWPVTPPNTACIQANSSSSFLVSSHDLYSSDIKINRRGLSKVIAEVSTLINSDGFTFTSPSVYIAFPTMSAFDNCAVLGEVHTSVTLSFHPQNMSTVVLRMYGQRIDATTLPFDFADAQCPPSWLGVSTLSFVGQIGYNPLIAPPPDLTLIDPAWNRCLAADFQGFDPPRILVPASNLAAPVSSEDSVIATIAASPIPSVKSPPVQTSPNSEPSLTALPDPVVGSPRAPDSPSMTSNSPTPHPTEKHPAASRVNSAVQPPIVSMKDVDGNGSRIPQSPPVQSRPNSEPSLMALPDQVVESPSPPTRLNPLTPHLKEKNPVVSRLNSAVQPPMVSTKDIHETGSQIPQSLLVQTSPNIEPTLMATADPVFGFARAPDSPSMLSNSPAPHQNIKTLKVSGLNSVVQPPTVFTTEVDENGSRIPQSTTDSSDPDVEISPNSKPTSALKGDSTTLAAQGSDFSCSQTPGSCFSRNPVIGSLDSNSDPISSHPDYVTAGKSIQRVSAAYFVVDSQTLTPDGVITASEIRISLDPSASFVVIASRTQMLRAPAATRPIVASTMIDGESTTGISASNSIQASSEFLLSNGVRIPIAKARITLAANDKVDAQINPTSPLTGPQITAWPPTPEAFTFGGHTYTAEIESAFSLPPADQVLAPSEAADIISATSENIATASFLSISTSNNSSFAAKSSFSSAQSLGAGIMSGIGGTANNGSTPTSFQGAAPHVQPGLLLMLLLLPLGTACGCGWSL